MGPRVFRAPLWSLLWLGAGCQDAAQEAHPVELGFLYSTQGFLGAFEPSYVDGAQMAADIINAGGGVLGRKLRIVPLNYAGDLEMARKQAHELLEAGAVALIGPLVLPYSDALYDMAETAERPMFVLNTDRPSVETPYQFHVLGNQADHATVMAKRSLGAGEQKLVIIHEVAFAASARTLADTYVAFGGEVLGDLELQADQSAEELWGEALAGRPDTVALVAGPAKGSALINAYVRSFSGTPVFFRLWPTFCTPDFAAGVPQISELRHESQSTAFQAGGEAYSAFAEGFARRFPRAPLVGSLSFDAVFATALALEAAGSTEGPALRAALPEVTAGGTAFDFRAFEAAKAAIARGEDVDYAGASHPFDFTVDGALTPSSALFVSCTFGPNGEQQLGTEAFRPSDPLP